MLASIRNKTGPTHTPNHPRRELVHLRPRSSFRRALVVMKDFSYPLARMAHLGSLLYCSIPPNISSFSSRVLFLTKELHCQRTNLLTYLYDHNEIAYRSRYSSRSPLELIGSTPFAATIYVSMNLRRECSCTSGSLEAPPHPVLMRTTTEL
jgi:hypothetical protein